MATVSKRKENKGATPWPLREKRRTSVNARVSKHNKASSLRPYPNRKFVTNLENTQARLQEVAHPSAKMKTSTSRGSAWNKRSFRARRSQRTKLFLGIREHRALCSSSPQARGPKHTELLWFSKAGVWQLLPTLCPSPTSAGIEDSGHPGQPGGGGGLRCVGSLFSPEN